MSWYSQMMKSGELARERNRREERRQQGQRYGHKFVAQYQLAALDKEKRMVEKELERIRKGIHRIPKLQDSKQTRGNNNLAVSYPRFLEQKTRQQAINPDYSKDANHLYGAILFLQNNPSALVPIINAHAQSDSYLETLENVTPLTSNGQTKTKKSYVPKYLQDRASKSEQSDIVSKYTTLLQRPNSPFLNKKQGYSPLLTRKQGNSPLLNTKQRNSPLLTTKQRNSPLLNTDQGNSPFLLNTKLRNSPFLRTKQRNSPLTPILQLHHGTPETLDFRNSNMTSRSDIEGPNDVDNVDWTHTPNDGSSTNRSIFLTEPPDECQSSLVSASSTTHRSRHPLSIAKLADHGMTSARENVTRRLSSNDNSEGNATDKKGMPPPSVVMMENNDKKNCRGPKAVVMFPTVDPEVYNPDGSVRTVYSMAPFEERWEEAKKARYVRTSNELERNKELSVKEIFAKQNDDVPDRLEDSQHSIFK